MACCSSEGSTAPPSWELVRSANTSPLHSTNPVGLGSLLTPLSNTTAMDPVTAIGLVSSILTFIEFSAKLISGAAEAYSSPSGLTADDQSAETVATEMQNFLRNLHPPDDSNLASNDKAICMLATECQLICEEILTLLERNRPKSRGSRRAALLAGLKSRWREVERRRLEERLRDCRFQLTLQLQHLTK